MKQFATIAAMAVFLGGCAYVDQAAGNLSTYYDAKAAAWFKTACTLNVGAVNRLDARKRAIVFAACPPPTAPSVDPKKDPAKQAGPS